ncbi:MAG: TSUP family transporter [Gammaproteobacteria bacterium]|nr:TSUP family transporter [Gammaproteobacteria bacterium]
MLVETLFLLFLVGGLAGFIDAIAGGGGLLSLPALLSAGLSPAQALATNKLQSVFGSSTAVWNFYRQGHIDTRLALPCIGWTVLGAALGALTVQHLDPDFLKRLIPWMLMGIALYILASPRLGEQDAKARLSHGQFALFVGFGLGFYDGFFGPGVGSFLVFAHVLLLGYGLLRASAQAKVINCTSNLTSVAFFALGGQMVWKVGLVMAAGQLIGAWLGSHLVMRQGARIVRPLLVVMSLSLTARLLYQDPGNPLHRGMLWLWQALLGG